MEGSGELDPKPTLIFCACCQEVRWVTTYSLEKFGSIRLPTVSEDLPVSLCMDCEEELLVRLIDYLQDRKN